MYATYRDGMRVVVRPKGGGLELTMEDREVPQVVPLVVEAVHEDKVVCVAYVGERKLSVLFRKKADGVELIYERYKLRRRFG